MPGITGKLPWINLNLRESKSLKERRITLLYEIFGNNFHLNQDNFLVWHVCKTFFPACDSKNYSV
jgi:hypothetical protein